MSLDSIVVVTITKATASVSRAGFGTPLIMSGEAKTLAAFASVVAKTYESVADMTTDLFASGGVAVDMATALFSQNPKPQQIIVARRDHKQTQIVDLTPVVANSTVYTVTINGTAFSFTSDTGATAQEIVEGLTAAINAGSEPVTASENNVKLTLTADVAGIPFTVAVARTLMTRVDVSTDPGITTDLATVRTDPSGNDDWYCLLLDGQGEAEIEAAAAYIETLPRIFIAGCGDTAIITSSTTDVASDLATSAYARTALIFHPNPHERPDCGWAGRCLPLDPGSETWKFKTLAGVAVYTLSPTERGYVVGKNANVYERIAGNNMTSEGTMASGEFIDTERFIDFITARIKEDVFLVLKNADKVPFTDNGIAMIETAIRGVLALGVNNGGFSADPAPTVTVPLASEVSSGNKADRLLPDVEFSGTLAGAIHSTQIHGTVSV